MHVVIMSVLCCRENCVQWFFENLADLAGTTRMLAMDDAKICSEWEYNSAVHRIARFGCVVQKIRSGLGTLKKICRTLPTHH
jgi:hypothetical protein